MLAHGAGPLECCKSIFAGQNNNIDSEMNARTQHRFNYRKQRECCFGHRCAKAARISEVAPSRRGHANMPPRTKSRSTQVPAKIGRPTKYSIEWAERFCDLIAEGRSVAVICAGPDMPSQQSVYTWLKQDEDFLERYARAREAQADKYFQEIIEIADAATPETVNVARLRVDSRKFTVARLAPKKYGDHTQILISCSSAGEDEEFIELSAAPEAARGAPQQGNGNLVRGSGGG